MKKSLSLLLALLFAALCFGCSTAAPGKDPAEAVGQTAANTQAAEQTEALPAQTEPAVTEPAAAEPTEPAPTEAPELSPEELIQSLLPDWEPYKTEEDTYYYRGFDYSELSRYINECTENGFTHIYEYGNSNTGRILYRDDVWIEIIDNTHDAEPSLCHCGLRFFPRMSEGGVTAEEAMASAGDPGIGKTPIAAIELSPEGLYTHTGLQLFRVLYDMRPEGDAYSGKNYNYQYFLVGSGGAQLLGLVSQIGGSANSKGGKHYMWKVYHDLCWGDVDGDGEFEAVMLGGTIRDIAIIPPVQVFRSTGGKPELVHSACYLLANGNMHIRYHLVTHDGKAYLAVSERVGSNDNGMWLYGDPVEYELYLEDGVVKTIGAEDMLECLEEWP